MSEQPSVPREWTGSEHKRALLPCLTGVHYGTGMEPRVHTEDWTRLRTVRNNNWKHIWQWAFINSFKLDTSYSPFNKKALLQVHVVWQLLWILVWHLIYPEQFFTRMLADITKSVVQQVLEALSLTMNAFFSSTVWKRPWPNLEVVSINFRSIFSNARRLVCTSRDCKSNEEIWVWEHTCFWLTFPN